MSNIDNIVAIQREVPRGGQIGFGTKFYSVEFTKTEYIREVCPICGDTGKVDIKGMTFDCPHCNSIRRREISSHITLRRFEVVEHIIHGIEIEGATVKAMYGKRKGEMDPMIRFHAFSKKGNAYDDISVERVSTSDFGNRSVKSVSDGISTANFLDKKEAESFCEDVNELQKKRLSDFNAANGTSREYPW